MMLTLVRLLFSLTNRLTLILVTPSIAPNHLAPGASTAGEAVMQVEEEYYEGQEEEMVADQEAGGFEGDLEMGDDDE
jgi:hypothetical protein